MGNFTIHKTETGWSEAKASALSVAIQVYGQRAAQTRVDAAFAGDTITAKQLALILDQNGDGRLVMDELNHDCRANPFAVYNWEDSGIDGMYRAYCVIQPQQQFNAFARIFSDRGGDVLEHVADWQNYPYREHEKNPDDVEDLGNNLPNLTQGYAPLTGHFAKQK